MTTEVKSSFDKQTKVMGHPAGLFLLFFTEMWERFSYYGMRALLVLFLVSAAGIGGWEWTNAEAISLYAWYTFLVYLTPIIGGIIADKITGFRVAILIGALLMTLGHASMAFETEFTFYLGLGLLILGNGMFKPNISSMVGNLYTKTPEKKDAGYTIFYMGINAGAFLGILLCGYIGEKVGWSYGFGLAGVFMFIGMVMFYFSKNIFSNIGEAPEDGNIPDNYDIVDSLDEIKKTPQSVITRDRLIVIVILAIFTIFFWMAFEQAGGSMTIFARNFTNRILEGSWATGFTIINTIITIVPLMVITYVLFLLVKASNKLIRTSNMFLTTSFLIIWGIVGWMVNKDFNTKAYEVSYNKQVENVEKTKEMGKPVFDKVVSTTVIRTEEDLATNSSIIMLDVNKKGKFRFANEELRSKLKPEQKVEATIMKLKDKELEVPASWFGILNSLFIILFAPLFSKIWESKYNPSAPIKFALGLVLLGLGFGVLAIGSQSILPGAETASISMIWLIVAYFLHTMGELALSPVGLSYVSKLSPPKLIGLMFGFWFTCTAFANFFAGLTGSMIDKISEEYSMSIFFLIFTIIPIVAGLILVGLNKYLIKKMHGIH